MKQLHPGDRVEMREAIEWTEGRVEWVSDDGQRVRVRWARRPGLEDQETREITNDLRKLAAA